MRRSLFVVQAKTADAFTSFLVPKGTAGLGVAEAGKAFAGENGRSLARWYHGTGSAVQLEKCRVPADSVLGKEGADVLGATYRARAEVLLAAVNLGVGRAAYDAAVDYSHIRVQGGRQIVQHQSIGGILADVAIKLELARTIIWKAAWAADNPEAVTDRSVSDLPLHTIARVYTAEAMHEATLGAAECFGAMGVMRDMPLQKYVHDAFIFLNGSGHDSATKLEIAEAVAGYERA
jgi:alkylation response protein AidB-like acyl-CoA dehydrogenase